MEFNNVTFACDDEGSLKHTKVFNNKNLFQCYHHNRGYCTFRDKCRYKHFKDIWVQVEKMANQAGTELTQPRLTGLQLYRNNIQADSPQEYYRLNVFIPFLDYILEQMKDRFSGHKQAIFYVSALIPSICNDYRFEHLQMALDIYYEFLPGSEAEIREEFKVWQTKWSTVKEPPSTAIDALELCDRNAFPNLHTMLLILCTLPVTTATAERTFSCIRSLKTYLRSTMIQSRLTGLAHMSINSKVFYTPEEVIDKFARGNRRLDFVL